LDLILFDPMNPRSLYSQLKNVHESLEILESSKVGMNRPVDLTVRRALNFLDTEIVSYNSDEDFHESVVSIGEFLDWMMKEIPQISEKLGWEFFTHVDYHSS